ncbi:MAG TPA: serine/threonine-protein kinase [Bryobacteraceae bacterium]|jgi:serine/threonine-protein kinase
MSRCPTCTAEIPLQSRFCLKCGAPVSAPDPAQLETMAMETVAMEAAPLPRASATHPPAPRPASTHVSRSGNSGIPAYRFDPGTLLASRYRVISRLGKGGMGEVFRADDIMLGQPVALKFLSESANGNLSLLTRFYDEVRIARQITHANVCRVYDIGEIEGQPYLSMEYIDGEDLGSLLRRIGRLPADKATEFARKMCAGLAAAHKQGVLHRDLKPANVMIDGRGELHIMDFGLAAVATQLEGAEVRNGTPAYMAPEQLEGREVSAQSDLYALGLIFYEMFTGKPAHEADTVAEVLELRRSSASVTNPSKLAADIDPAVERAILRCLEPDPKLRPASALALAAALPGGDPLAAALAAGETPSPEVVAASGSNEGLSPKIAIPALAGVIAGLIAVCVLMPKIQVAAYVPFEDPPEALTVKARDIVRSLGYANAPADTQAGFYYDAASLDFAKASGPAQWRTAMATLPSPLLYSYRQSPAPLVPQSYKTFPWVTFEDPIPNVSGMVNLSLDPGGRLMGFDAVPPQMEKPASYPAPDWTPLFAAAHFDLAQFKPDEPQWTPLDATDARTAWTGTYPGNPNLPIRVEAAAFHGRPIHFEIIWPWTKPTRMPGNASKTAAERAASLASGLWFMFLMGVGIWLAWFNWKAGRGDMRGAARLGIALASISLLRWALSAHHVAEAGEYDLFTEALAQAAYAGIRYWIFYLALEPWVRRYWPQNLVTWSRLLAGRWRDPLVGRDVLFGILLGLVYLLFFQSYFFANLFHGSPPLAEALIPNSARFWVSTLADHVDNATGGALYFFMFLFVLRAVFRKQWLAGLVFVLIFVAIRWHGEGPWYTPLFLFAIWTTLVVVMLRFGLFATMCLVSLIDTPLEMMFTTDFSAWYGESSLAIVAVIGAAAVWGFRTSLGGRTLIPALKS